MPILESFIHIYSGDCMSTASSNSAATSKPRSIPENNGTSVSENKSSSYKLARKAAFFPLARGARAAELVIIAGIGASPVVAIGVPLYGIVYKPLMKVGQALWDTAASLTKRGTHMLTEPMYALDTIIAARHLGGEVIKGSVRLPYKGLKGLYYS